MHNQDPTDPSRRPAQGHVTPSRAARHGAAPQPASRHQLPAGDPQRRRRRRAIPLVVAVVTIVGGLAGGVIALDRRGTAGGAATTEGTGPAAALGDAALAARGGPRLATSTTTATAPRRARGMSKDKTTTTEPASSRPASGSGDSTKAPPADGFPGPGSTGVPAGVSLTSAGSLTVSRAGAVIDRRDIRCLSITASNVTVRRSRIRCGSDYPVRIANGARNVVLEDVEIDGLGSPSTTAIGSSDYTLRRADVHDVGDGPRVSDNTVIEDSWIHDLAVGGGSHNDGIQATDGSNIRILHNRIEHPNEQTSCVLIGADLGNISDVLVQGNLLNGGNYTVYAGADPGYQAVNVRIVGNRFGRSAVYGTHRIQSNITFSGNVWHDTGNPIAR